MTDSSGTGGYDGPPKTTPPPKGWKVPEVIAVVPARELPRQNHRGIDAAESRARTFSLGLAGLAAALLFVVLVVLVVRLST